jgi:hypothetical protein
MAYGWRGEGLSSEGEPERMRFAGRADSIGRTNQDDSERSSCRKRMRRRTGWSQPAHKLQTRPPAKVLAARISMSHLVPLLEFNHSKKIRPCAQKTERLSAVFGSAATGNPHPNRPGIPAPALCYFNWTAAVGAKRPARPCSLARRHSPESEFQPDIVLLHPGESRRREGGYFESFQASTAA